MHSTPLLPSASSDEAWDALLADDAALRHGVGAIALRHGFAGAEPLRFDSGSLPVYALGDTAVLKLYPPHEREHAEVEARVLGFVAGRLPIATPRVLARGGQDGWHTLLMSRLRGRRLVEVWPDLTPAARDRAADALGKTIAALHALDTAPLAGLAPDWDAFTTAQRASAVERQRARGLGALWLAQIDPFLAAWMPAAPVRRVLLHTELMREHLMIDGTGDAATLAGVFDFEPAMLGDPAYEFASIGLFFSCGDAHLLQRTLRACGTASHADHAPCRLMAHTLLHRYSNLRWYLERLPVPGATTLEALANAWWGRAA